MPTLHTRYVPQLKELEPWQKYFSGRGFNCLAPSWTLNQGEPEQLRNAPPSGLGELRLDVIIDSIKEAAALYADDLVLVGHSVRGLIVHPWPHRSKAYRGAHRETWGPDLL